MSCMALRSYAQFLCLFKFRQFLKIEMPSLGFQIINLNYAIFVCFQHLQIVYFSEFFPFFFRFFLFQYPVKLYLGIILNNEKIFEGTINLISSCQGSHEWVTFNLNINLLNTAFRDLTPLLQNIKSKNGPMNYCQSQGLG